MRPALLVIDIQNRWLNRNAGLKECMERRVGTVNSAIRLFREKGLPIVRVYHVNKEDGPDPGTDDFEFLSSIGTVAGDRMVIKNYGNAFNRTDLMNVLGRDIDTVILCGLSATACVMATYVGAEDNDLHPYILKDGVAAGSEELIGFAERIFETLSVSELERSL